jgi:hypothetical protein
MESSLFSIKYFVKYLIIVGLIYSILKMVPSQQISQKDITLIIAIALIGFISLDSFLCKKSDYETFTTQPTQIIQSQPIVQMGQSPTQPIQMKQSPTQPIQMIQSPTQPIQMIQSPTQPIQMKQSPTQPIQMIQSQPIVQMKQSPTQPIQMIQSQPIVQMKQSPTQPIQMKQSPTQPIQMIQSQPIVQMKQSPTQPIQMIQSQPIVQMGQSQPITQSKVVTQPIQMIQSQPIAQSKVVTQPIAQSIVAQPKQVIQPIAQSNINNSIAIKYFESLINDLSEKGLLDQNEIANIKIKMNSKLLTIEEIIKSLEVLKTTGKSKFNKLKDDSIYNELPPEFYAPLADKKLNEWDNDYTILNTTKWQVPMLRPPVCVNTIPCQICPSDSSNYSVNLKYWDESRYVTSDNKINKKWVANQN